MLIKLYHGTTTACLDNIKESGLSKATYLTSDYEQAQYYANCATDENGGRPHIITATVNTDNLQADLPSFNEPLSFILDANGLTEDEWHEAINNEEITYPEVSDWQTSLKTVASVFHKQPILAKNINFDNAQLSDKDLMKINEVIGESNTKKNGRCN